MPCRATACYPSGPDASIRDFALRGFLRLLLALPLRYLRVCWPDLPRAFKTPLVPVVPILGMGIPLLLMLSLPGSTWLRLIVWLILGMVVYFGYGRTHSKLARQRATRDERNSKAIP